VDRVSDDEEALKEKRRDEVTKKSFLALIDYASVDFLHIIDLLPNSSQR
jgi:hypothetical protein